MAKSPEIQVETRHRFFFVSRLLYGVAGKMLVCGRVNSLFIIVFVRPISSIFRFVVGK